MEESQLLVGADVPHREMPAVRDSAHAGQKGAGKVDGDQGGALARMGEVSANSHFRSPQEGSGSTVDGVPARVEGSPAVHVPQEKAVRDTVRSDVEAADVARLVDPEGAGAVDADGVGAGRPRHVHALVDPVDQGEAVPLCSHRIAPDDLPARVDLRRDGERGPWELNRAELSLAEEPAVRPGGIVVS